MDIELLKKYCDNRCSEEELLSVLDWFTNSANSPKGQALLLKLWEDIDEVDHILDQDINHILDRIHHKIDLTNSKELLEVSHYNGHRYIRMQAVMKILRNAAAIFLIPVLGFGIFMSSKYNSIKRSQISVNQAYHEVFSSEDAITTTTLPDGSKVWLNHNSSLKYPATFIGKSRRVELTGEGYFEVTPNSKIPFVVQAGEIQVMARGTSFNILAYPGEGRVETSLIKGIVELIIQGQSKRHDVKLELKPMEMAVYDSETNETYTYEIFDNRYYAWKEGKLVFNKAPMNEVVRKLNRWFNTEIQIQDPELYDLTLTATFVHETLPQVLSLIEMVTPIHYTITNREVKEDGTFTKRKVLLCYRKG